jgi:hypothetical protein
VECGEGLRALLHFGPFQDGTPPKTEFPLLRSLKWENQSYPCEEFILLTASVESCNFNLQFVQEAENLLRQNRTSHVLDS